MNIIDLTLVAAAFGNTADAAPTLWSLNTDDMPTRATVEQVVTAKRVNLT